MTVETLESLMEHLGVVEDERDSLLLENEKMTEYLLYLNDCNKIPLERDDFGWLLKRRNKYVKR